MSKRDVTHIDVRKLLELSKQVEAMIKEDSRAQHYSDEGEINIRDLSRFLNLYSNFVSKDGVSASESLLQAFRICYLQRLSEDKQNQALTLLA
jgi:hypothetical protein